VGLALCVVHVVRHANGWEPFDRFVTSCEDHPSGTEHDWLLVFKGFPGNEVPSSYLERAAPLRPSVLTIADEGFDIGAYYAAARANLYEAFCFLNSFSIVLCDGWLGILRHHDALDVGLVGTTGSWESLYTDLVLDLPGGPVSRLRGAVRARRELLHRRMAYPPFPNPHLRSNAFLVRREVLLRMVVPPLATKEEAMYFESGRRSLTRQVLALGLKVLVAGADGSAYPPDAWRTSGTFRSGEQSNLLVADNRTRQYELADPAERARLAAFSWGRY
jgi:hypothetical protein